MLLRALVYLYKKKRLNKLQSDMEGPHNKRNPRDKAIKRWTNNETNALLDYIQHTHPFEQPSARIYYKKFLDTTNIQTTWSSVRWKVRNLRLSYNKASLLLKNSNADPTAAADEIEKVNEKVYKICPYFVRLSQIFVNKLDADATALNDTINYKNLQMNDCINYAVDSDKDVKFPISPPLTNNYNEQESYFNKILEPAIKMELSCSKNMDEIKLKIEEERLRKEYELQDKKLKLEEIKIKNDFELKKLEIEKNERVARYELDLKYNKNVHLNQIN